LKQSCCERADFEVRRLNEGDDRATVFWSRHQWCDPRQNCQIPDCTHEFYAKEIGVPAEVAYAERGFFLGVSKSYISSWGRRFIDSVPVGVELDTVWKEIALHVLANNQDGMINFAQTREQNDVVVKVIELIEENVTDPPVWDAVIGNAERVIGRGSKSGNQLEALEAMALSGYRAAQCATAVARSFRDARFAAEAIRLSGEPAQWRAYSKFLTNSKDPRYTAPRDSYDYDEREKESKGRAAWTKLLESAKQVGTDQYERTIGAYANKFIELIAAKAPPAPPNWISRLFTNMFGGGSTPPVATN
jgi:hypothetical protein